VHDCPGKHFDVGPCPPKPACPSAAVNWEPWGRYGPCSASCGGGYKLRLVGYVCVKCVIKQSPSSCASILATLVWRAAQTNAKFVSGLSFKNHCSRFFGLDPFSAKNSPVDRAAELFKPSIKQSVVVSSLKQSRHFGDNVVLGVGVVSGWGSRDF